MFQKSDYVFLSMSLSDRPEEIEFRRDRSGNWECLSNRQWQCVDSSSPVSGDRLDEVFNILYPTLHEQVLWAEENDQLLLTSTVEE